MNILFHSLADMSLSIDNLLMHDSLVYSLSDGVYNSFGIGLATNCIFVLNNIYIGDIIDTGINPLVTFNFD